MAFHRETLKIHSVQDGVFLDAWLFKPSLGTAPFPLVVAGHGMTAIKDAGLATFGEHWATQACFASLIFDYRCFGESDGEPRNVVDLEKQIEDYRSILKWARQTPELFQIDKIVVMGSALSGLTVATLALEEHALAGVMAHSPMLDGYATVMSAGFNPRLLFWATVDTLRSKLGLTPLFIRAVGKVGEFALLNTPSAHPGFTAMFDQGMKSFSDVPNLIAPRIVFQLMGARHGLQLKHSRCPVLLVSTKEDDMIPVAIVRDIAETAPDLITYVEVPGGHFDIMPEGKGFNVNIDAQIHFLKNVLAQ